MTGEKVGISSVPMHLDNTRNGREVDYEGVARLLRAYAVVSEEFGEAQTGGFSWHAQQVNRSAQDFSDSYIVRFQDCVIAYLSPDLWR